MALILVTYFVVKVCFHKVSFIKIGFIFLVKELVKNGYKLIDCQVPSAHLKSLGAEEISRSDFLKYLS